MNLLSTILDRLNQRIEVGNIFDQIYGLSEPVGEGNDKAWAFYIGNGQAIPVTNFDAKQGTLFWAKRGKITVAKNDSLRLAGCKSIYETRFSMTAYAMVRKSHLPCDSADAQDWIASRVLRLISGTDPQFKAAIGVIAYEVVPSGYQNEIRYLPVNYEWAAVAIDVDVNVSTSSEDGCYDTCATGDIPLPDFEPCTPCLTEVAVDGVTITGNGTAGDPLIAIGGGGGGGALIALPFTTDHLSATGNAYAIGNIVWYNGNVYRCIAANDSILPTNTSYWVNLGAGFPTVQQPSNWNATSGNNQILNKPTIPVLPATIVEDVTATAPISSSGGTTPDISITQADGSTDGYLSSADWNTFDGKFDTPTGTSSDYLDGTGAPQPFPTLTNGTVTSVATAGLISGGPITTSGTITTAMTTNKLVGRATAGSGIMEEITVGSGLTLTGAGVLNNTATPTPTGYYGAFQDDTTQTAVSANTAYPVKFNTTDLSNGVTVVNDGSANPTRVTIANTGIYDFQFSLQLEKTGGSGNFIIDIWLRKNGVDIPDTAGKVVLTGSANASPIVAAWNYLLDLAGGDYVQLIWSTTNNNAIIFAEGPVAPHPGVPSSILTVTQQAGIMAGTGITAINSLTGAVQTIGTGTTGTDFAVVSSGTSHTFNLPTASASNRGALSTTDWSTFNGKFNTPTGTPSEYVRGDGTLATFPSLPLIYKSTADTVGYSGTANTAVYTQAIAANTFAAGDIIRITYRTRKTGTAGNQTLRMYANTTANLSGSPILLGTWQNAAANNFLFNSFTRNLVIKNSTNNTEVLNAATTSQSTDFFLALNATTCVINWTTNQFIVFAIQNSNAGDTNFGSMYLIEKL
jgi:hypothetical protein